MARQGKPIDPEARFLSPRQAARVLGVSEFLIYNGVVSGEVPCRRLGQRILIPRAWVDNPGSLETAPDPTKHSAQEVRHVIHVI